MPSATNVNQLLHAIQLEYMPVQLGIAAFNTYQYPLGVLCYFNVSFFNEIPDWEIIEVFFNYSCISQIEYGFLMGALQNWEAEKHNKISSI